MSLSEKIAALLPHLSMEQQQTVLDFAEFLYNKPMKHEMSDVYSVLPSILHASVLVEDTQTALAFYHDVLGLPIDPQRPSECMGYAGAWLDVNTAQQIHLLELPNPDPRIGRPEHGGRDRHVALSVQNLDTLAQRLEDADIAYTRSKSGRAALFCRDPDGNALEFVETPL